MTNISNTLATPVAYSQASEGASLFLPTDRLRAPVSLLGDIHNPILFREALLALGEVWGNDLRYRGKNREAYLAYLTQQAKGVSPKLWEAQKSYLEEKYNPRIQDVADSDGLRSRLEPILHVTRQGASIEVLSADESAYARLWFKDGEAYSAKEIQEGSTYINLSADILRSLRVLRHKEQATVLLGQGTQAKSESNVELKCEVPHRWLRAFSQIQLAATLDATSFEISPIDLYNLIFLLRLNRASRSPRSLRYELVPGQLPRMVLEPWDFEVKGTGEVFGGQRAQIIRTWGRRRLNLLARLLPFAQKVTVYLLGVGLPAFYVLDLGQAYFCLGLSGWIDAGWGAITHFDRLMPPEGTSDVGAKVLTLVKEGPKSADELVEKTSESKESLRVASLDLIQQGVVYFDLSQNRYVHRQMMADPLDSKLLRYQNEREALAHRLLDQPGLVKLTKVHDLGKDGTRIEGEVQDPKAHRTYKSNFTVDREGRVVDAWCSSPDYRRTGLKEGPSMPMIALRLLHIRELAEQERVRNTIEGRAVIRAETRTMMRGGKYAMTYRVSLNEKQVSVSWGPSEDDMRMQQIFFSTEDRAKVEYFSRLERLSEKGYVDVSF